MQVIYAQLYVFTYFYPSLIFKQIYVMGLLLLVTSVEGDPKAPFSIATTQRCREGCYSIP